MEVKYSPPFVFPPLHLIFQNKKKECSVTFESFSSSSLFSIYRDFRVYLGLEKLERKKKVWKVIFFSMFGLRKVKRKKIERKNGRKLELS